MSPSATSTQVFSIPQGILTQPQPWAAPMPHNPSAEWSFANIQSTPALLKTISSCPISFYLGEETPKLAQDSCAAALEAALGQSQSPGLSELLREAPGEGPGRAQAAAVPSPSKLESPPGSLPESTQGQKLTAEHTSLEEKSKKQKASSQLGIISLEIIYTFL